jgi:cardiolipin synthase
MRVLDDVGIKVHKLHHMKLHAKLVMADGERAIVGSVNLAPGSFDERRELAIEVDDRKIVRRLGRVIDHDWKHSRPIDLSDKGLARDLKKYGPGVIHELALNPDLDPETKPDKNRQPKRRSSSKKKRR